MKRVPLRRKHPMIWALFQRYSVPPKEIAMIPDIKAQMNSVPPKTSISLRRLKNCIPGLGSIEGRRKR
jgi:hypothetical protein